jgi:hypothetical protein
VAADILHLRLTVSDRILRFETQREASRQLLDNIREGAAFAGLGYAFFDDNQLENAASHFRSCLKIAA